MKGAMKPAHPGAILREDILKELGLTITKAAEGLHISSAILSDIVDESAAVTAEIALRFEKGFGVEAAFWLGLQNNFDLWKINESGQVNDVTRISPVAA